MLRGTRGRNDPMTYILAALLISRSVFVAFVLISGFDEAVVDAADITSLYSMHV